MYREQFKKKESKIFFSDTEKYMKAKLGFRQSLINKGNRIIKNGNRIGDFLSNTSIPEIQGFRNGTIKLKIQR